MSTPSKYYFNIWVGQAIRSEEHQNAPPCGVWILQILLMIKKNQPTLIFVCFHRDPDFKRTDTNGRYRRLEVALVNRNPGLRWPVLTRINVSFNHLIWEQFLDYFCDVGDNICNNIYLRNLKFPANSHFERISGIDAGRA